MGSRFDGVPFDEVSASLRDVFTTELKKIEVLLGLHFEPSRELSLAMTNLEEAHMWINKTIKWHQVNRIRQAKKKEMENEAKEKADKEKSNEAKAVPTASSATA